MKKITFTITALLLIGCSNNPKNSTPTEQPASIVEKVEKVEDVAMPIDTVAVRNKAVEELKSWGARDARFDPDGYLVYAVATTDLSASAEDVAREMYILFLETPTLKGVRVVNYIDNKELGCYPDKPDTNE